jgi:hypothetical protein
MNLMPDTVTSFFKAIAESVGSLGLFADDGPDGGPGVLMSGLAGVAAALAVAILLTVYFRSGYRSTRDMIRHGLAAAAVLGFLVFVAYDMHRAGLAYLCITPSKPEVEFELRLPKATASGLADRSHAGPNGAFAIRTRVL